MEQSVVQPIVREAGLEGGWGNVLKRLTQPRNGTSIAKQFEGAVQK